jgi:hypothetical protein
MGLPGKNIHEDIGTLVKQGLSTHTQQSLDILRVTGNNAVHPGEVNLDENPRNVLTLFSFLNYILHDSYIRKLLNDRYGDLPEGAKKQIEKRDKK